VADITFNIAKGRVAELVDPAGQNLPVVVVLLEEAAADATLADYNTLAQLLAAPSNTECSGGTYVRKTGISATVTVDDANDRVDVDIPDQTWTSLSTFTGAPTVKAVFCAEESASDAGRIPLVALDWAIVPDGSYQTLRMP